jgi:hypothetical protein
MDMIARCLTAPTTAPTTVYATTALAIATSNGRELTARCMWTRAQINAQVTALAHKSSVDVSATKSFLGCRVSSGSMLLMVLSLTLAATIALETEYVNTPPSTTRRLQWAASARRIPNRPAA